ncbi:MAG: 30S ribosomal protein S16 [Patescibacteria group bacterium]
MVMIRLSRVGKTKFPSYRIIVSDKRKDLWGTALEIVGFYNPLSTPKLIDLKKDRIAYWISKGAQASATLHNMFVDQKIVPGPKVSVSRMKRGAKEAAKEAKAPAS